MTLEGDARQDPRDPRARRLPARPPRRADGEPLARHAAEGRARAGAADVAGAPSPRRADDGPRPALEARGAGVHPRDPRDARLDDPALHARPRRGRDARGAHRHPRPRASCSRSSRRRTSSAATTPRRSRRRSSPQRVGSSRRRATKTTTGRCSHESSVGNDASRARRSRRRRRAQLLPHQALHLVGPRLVLLDRREHAHDRLHRPGHRGDAAVEIDVNAYDDVPAHRRGRLGVPRHPLRVPDGDGRLGALGGDDRVHVHGAAVACHASRRPGRVRDPLRAPPRCLPVHRLRALLRPVHARRELRRGARRSSPSRRSRSSGSG